MVHSNHEIYLTGDSYIMNENQVSLVLMLWLSEVVVHQAFTPRGVDMHVEVYLLIIAW